MEKATKAEMVAALVTDKYSGFKDGDEPLLESCSDTRLEEFRAASETRKSEATASAKVESDNRNLSARLKVAEEKVKASEAELDEDAFIAKAPPVIKTLIESHKAQEAEEKASYVALLKDCGANTEDELKKMEIVQLRTLAKYARVEVPDFSGRAISVDRNQERKNYAPPDPYADGLKALRAKLN